MGLLYMAAISSVAAYTLFYWALRYMEASRVAAVNYFQPVGAILVAAIFLREVPTRYLLLGGVLILLGVYLAERSKAVGRRKWARWRTERATALFRKRGFLRRRPDSR